MARSADQSIKKVVDDLVDGIQPDWRDAEAATKSPEQERRLVSLRALAAVAASGWADQRGPGFVFRAFTVVVIALASLRAGAVVVSGSAALLFGGGSASTRQLVFIITFGTVAGVLLIAGRSDRRAVYLGTFYLLVAAAFAGAASAIRLPVESWLPFFFWRFANVFPAPMPDRAATQRTRTATIVALVTGTGLFLANVAMLVGINPVGIFTAVNRLDAGTGYYWPALFIVLAPAFPVMLLRARTASAEQRKRAGLFTKALVLGISPVLAAVLLETPGTGLALYIQHPVANRFVEVLVDIGLLSLPLSTAYAVFVHRIVTLRFVIRRTAQYALAKQTLRVVAAAPLLLIAHQVYLRRDEPIGLLISQVSVRGLLLFSSGALAALYTRERLLRLLDGRFSRDRVDFEQVSRAFADGVRLMDNPAGVADLLRRSVDRIVRADRYEFFVFRHNEGIYQRLDGAPATLSASSALARIAAKGVMVSLSIHDPDTARNLIPADERTWVEASGAVWLLPIIGTSSLPIALLAIGERRSHLNLTHEEQALLTALAAAAAARIESTLGTDARAVARDDADRQAWQAWKADNAAVECKRCGTVGRTGRLTCVCDGEIENAPVPAMLNKKFRIERRVGQGAMGVVYQATDMSLRRTVAIKTLPRSSDEHNERLRREARTMAALSHPHVAVIYGIEAWRGCPMLVVEYLGGGTLADRIRIGPLPAAQVAEMGIALAGALDTAHRALILHRDIKPSNIGFSLAKTPKILDFGLAAFTDDAWMVPSGSTDVPKEQLADVTFWATLGAAGTPLYLSPEALAGHLPQPSFDLWGLALVLYEALLGQHPFMGANWSETRKNIESGTLLHRPATTPLSALLERNLSPHHDRRTATAAEFRSELEALR